MEKKTVKLLVAAAAMLVSASLAFATPPPAPQTVGIKDTVFKNFSGSNYKLCRDCHTPGWVTATDSDLVLKDKHHALINQPGGVVVSCNNASGTLPANLATGCHYITTDPVSGVTAVQNPRPCFNCHTKGPHHLTDQAAAQNCKYCHGSAIDNPGDGHWIPTSADYAMDTTFNGMTPAPVGRSVVDPTDPTKTVIVQGCEACHQASTTLQIFANKDTHHSTGIGQDLSPVGNCTWCHAATGSENNFTIRACEACHGIASLHNIQADSPNAANLGTIVASNEEPGFGHVGNNWDCVGCHYSWTGTAVSDTTATAPFVNEISAITLPAGVANTLTLTGMGFTNLDATGNNYIPTVVLARGTQTFNLIPFSTSVSEVKVALPATLVAGVYEVRVNKGGETVSNLKTLTLTPKLAATNALLTSTTLTITGTGFGTAPANEYQGLLGVFVDDVQANIVSWSNTKIVATGTNFAAGKLAVVKSVYGDVTRPITVPIKK